MYHAVPLRTFPPVPCDCARVSCRQEPDGSETCVVRWPNRQLYRQLALGLCSMHMLVYKLVSVHVDVCESVYICVWDSAHMSVYTLWAE